MSLTTEVQDRYGAQVLINLTNPEDEEPTAINTTKFGKAADDVEADFKTYAGIVYDGTDDRHVSLACEGVMIKLMVRAGDMKPKEEKAWREEDLKQGLALVTSRDRLLPTSGSILSTSSEQVGDEKIYGDFDRRKFRRVVPEDPSVGDDPRLE